MKLLIDANALLNQALLRGEDKENGRKVEFEGKSVQVNGAEYGLDGFMLKIQDAMKEFNRMPRDIILVWDGRNSKEYRRGRYLATYKAGRDKAPEVSEQLNIARGKAIAMMKGLGAQSVTVDGMEADDVLAFLAKSMRDQKNTVISGDGDLTVLHDDNTDVFINGNMNTNPFGPFPIKYITLYKALVGDTSDKLPGAKGFGDAAFTDLVRTFGLDGLDDLILHIEEGRIKSLRENVADFPKMQSIVDSEQMVTACWQCAKLYPEEVDTPRRRLQWTVGMLEDYNKDTHWAELAGLYGRKKLVSAENYDASYRHFQAHVQGSGFVALDIETSHTQESLDWLETIRKKDDKGGGVDPLGSRLNGMSLTYGPNGQYTMYMTVGHVEEPGISNITVDQCRQMVELIPKSMHILIQNRNFEFTVLHGAWGDKWKDNGWYGFVPNALDTKIEASYVDENLPKGLKDRSKIHLGYEQQTYQEVTGGKQMNELTARHVLNYGCDDTICTAALHNWYRIVMEIEGTWKTYLMVEQLPEYLTTLAYIQGAPISRKRLQELIEADNKVYDENWKVLREYLLSKGWEGSVCPVYDEITPAAIKEAVLIITGDEFTTRKRKLNAVADDLRNEFPDNADAHDIASIVDLGDVAALNAKVKMNFDGEPKLNFNSPRQIQKLLYEVIKITPRIYNSLTEKERQDTDFAKAYNKLRDYKKDPSKVEVTDEMRAVWSKKSSTDDQAVAMAVAMDNLGSVELAALKAYTTIKSVMTKRNLFYANYLNLPHWSDQRIHASLNQSEAVTRRYSASKPNVQQLPKRDEGVVFREVYVPHMKDAVVVSLDYEAQELRLCSELSKDEAMLSCYVGDSLKDLHSLTAVAAAPYLWGESPTYEEFIAMLDSPDKSIKAKAKALRASGKLANFSGIYGAQAPNLALQLMIEESEAQAFLDARDEAFPGVKVWKEKVEAEASERGYAKTLLGARRHLAEALNAESKWDRMRAERQASNYEIQGGCSEMTKLAMGRMWQSGVFTSGLRAQFYFPVHDEVVFSVHRDDAVTAIQAVHKCMTARYANMTVPIESSISLGATFGQQIELGNVPSEEAINEALVAALGA